MNLTDHFTLEELTHSDVALRKGLDNTPDAETVENLTELARGLEEVRSLLGQPIHINSGYRSAKVNAAVGSKESSAHRKGYAADFVCPSFGTPQDICHAIMGSTIQYDQLIFEGTWVHFSVAPEMRRNNLTAHFGGNGVTYSHGFRWRSGMDKVADRALRRFPCRDIQVSADGEFQPATSRYLSRFLGCLRGRTPALSTELQPIFKNDGSAFPAAATE